MAHRKLQPAGDRILIRYANKAPGVARVPRQGAAVQKPLTAKIIAVGPGAAGRDGKVTPLDLKVGEHVLVPGTRGIAIRVRRRNYAILRGRDVLVARS